MAARANASAGTRVASPNAAHMATTAYGLQAPRKPIQTATDSYGEEAFTQSAEHWFISNINNLRSRRASHLDDDAVRVGGLGLRWHMLLDGLTWPPHCQQDEGVGEEDDGTGQRVAEEEQGDDVRQSWKLVVRRPPVNAAGRAVRLGAITTPLRQGPHGEHGGETPHSNHQEVGVRRRELVPWWERRWKKIYGDFVPRAVDLLSLAHSFTACCPSPWFGKLTLRQHTKERAVRLVKLQRPNRTPHMA